MAPHSSIHVWRIPWTEEPGGLQSVRSQNWIQLSNLYTHTSDGKFSSVFSVVQY